MNQEEHLTTAQDLMSRASQESKDGGNNVIAAEFLWGGFAHCLIVVAQNEGLLHDSHGAFTRIAQHINAPRAATDGAAISGQATNCTSTSTTAACRHRNRAPTPGRPPGEPCNSWQSSDRPSGTVPFWANVRWI